MEITLQQLVDIAPLCAKHAPAYVGPINDSLDKAGINTPQRLASYIAQLMHESGCLVYSKELASGAEYEGRHDLGNTHPGDGVRFKGRGPIQVTGRTNYAACSVFLFGDERLLDHPELLEQPENGVAAAAWFWHYHGCNQLADENDQRALCRRINGGMNGFDERFAFYEQAAKVLGVTA
jgi:putative chitinase